MPCLALPAVPNIALSGGLSLQPPGITIPALTLLCCSTPVITVQLPGLAVGASVALIIAPIIEAAVDTVLAYLDEIPLPCLKDPPPADEL